MRQAGILVAIGSLPSRYGIGDFGMESYRFIDDLKESGCRIWQLLPLHPLGYGNSPYQPYSSTALEELYISLDLLFEEGLIRKPRQYRGNWKRIDYPAVRTWKEKYYKEAYITFYQLKKHLEDSYQLFLSQNWVFEYAVFRALKQQNENRCWNKWPKDQQDWIKDRRYNIAHLQEEIGYQIFLQYILNQQWMKLKQYANDRGIRLMGDIPFYVGLDSADVWANQSCFLLDDKSHPAFVAGVPPDYFSETGQRWENPIYDWEYLKQTGFSFWVTRLSRSKELFDIVRIDHFRAFDTYWMIPAFCPTAIEGTWVEAPGYELFDTVLSQLKDLMIVVEDLGELREEVHQLRDHYGFPGMDVVQFTFDPKRSLEEKENIVAYSGTHDNPTLRSWYRALSAKEKCSIRRYFHVNQIPGKTMTQKFIWFTLQKKADLAIVPIQDMLGLGDEGRMNTPGTVGSPNWEWKLENWRRWKEALPFLKQAVLESGRMF